MAGAFFTPVMEKHDKQANKGENKVNTRIGNNENGTMRAQFIDALNAVRAFYSTNSYESSIAKMMGLTGWSRKMAEACYEMLDNDGVETFGNFMYESAP